MNNFRKISDVGIILVNGFRYVDINITLKIGVSETFVSSIQEGDLVGAIWSILYDVIEGDETVPVRGSGVNGEMSIGLRLVRDVQEKTNTNIWVAEGTETVFV